MRRCLVQVVLDARQMRGEWLAASPVALRFVNRGRELFDEFSDLGDIFVPGVFKQIPLDSGQCFIFHPVAYPAQMG